MDVENDTCERQIVADGDAVSEVPPLPPEVLTLIFRNFVSGKDNIKQLRKCMRVCKLWRQVAVEIFRDLCLDLWNNEPGSRPLFNQHKFEEKIRHSPYKCMEFYLKMYDVRRRLRLTEVDPHPKTLKHDAVEGVTVDHTWASQHNYKGIYDMVYVHPHNDRSKTRHSKDKDGVDYIVCSVYDTIQVWDVNKQQRVGLITGNLLDVNGASSTCFNVTPDATRLICGTSNFKLNVHNLFTGELLESLPVNNIEDVGGMAGPGRSLIVSDVRCFNDQLMALDNTGKLHRWSIPPPGKGMKYVRSFFPPFERNLQEDFEVNSAFSLRENYTKRQFSRLLDFNDHLILCTSADWICIASTKNSTSATFERTYGEPLCCKLWNSVVYCGHRTGAIMKYTLRKEHHQGFYVNAAPKSLVSQKQTTVFEDSITSLDVSVDGKILIVGDVNGEIHGFTTDSTKFGNGENAALFTLSTSHKHGSFIWSVHLDDGRLFSGDSDGMLVVHDFLDFEAEDEPPNVQQLLEFDVAVQPNIKDREGSGIIPSKRYRPDGRLWVTSGLPQT